MGTGESKGGGEQDCEAVLKVFKPIVTVGTTALGIKHC